MEKLTHQTLCREIRLCENNSQYRVGIATLTVGEAKTVIEDIRKELSADKEAHILKSSPNFNIHWDNGSLMSIFVATESSRGRRYHKVLYDDRIDKQILREVVCPFETWRYKQGNK